MTEIDLQALQTGIRRPPRMDGMRPVDPESTSERADAQTQKVRKLSGRPIAGDPRIPPPEPDGFTPVASDDGELAALVPEQNGTVAPPTQAVKPSVGDARLVVSFGRREGECIVGIERAPEWDLETTKVVSFSAVKELLPILRKLARLKDMTSELED